MVKPCDICLVKACCSEPCVDYAKYIYDTKEYQLAGNSVAANIKNMTREKAIDHILMVEKIHKIIQNSNSFVDDDLAERIIAKTVV